MNKAERKERIEEVVDLIEQAIKNLQSDIERYETAVKKLEELDEFMEDIEGWDREELEVNLLKSIVENCGIEDAKDSLQEFKSDLESYMYDLSDSKREPLEEKFSGLDDVLDSLDLDEFDGIHGYIERMQDNIQNLKYATK